MSKRQAIDQPQTDKADTVVVNIIGLTKDIPVLVTGELAIEEYELLKTMAASEPTARQAEVAKDTAIGKVLRKVYQYDEENNFGESLFNMNVGDKAFKRVNENMMSHIQGYTLIWYLVE